MCGEILVVAALQGREAKQVVLAVITNHRQLLSMRNGARCQCLAQGQHGLTTGDMPCNTEAVVRGEHGFNVQTSHLCWPSQPDVRSHSLMHGAFRLSNR